MKKHIIIVCLLIIILNFTLVNAGEKTIYDLSKISKKGEIHVISHHTLERVYGNTAIHYSTIPREAYNLNISPSYLAYKRYSQENQDELRKDLSWCSPSDPNNRMVKSNSNEDIIWFNTLEIWEDSINVVSEYNQPLKTEKTKIFNNWAGFVGDYSTIEIILPEDSYLWSYSEEYSQRETGEDNNLVVTWESVDKLEITFGSAPEYLIHDSQKDNFVNNYVTIAILVLTIILSFIFNANVKRTSKEYIDKNIKFYLIFLGILTLGFILLPYISGGMLQPFVKSYVLSLVGFLLLFSTISVLILKVIYKMKK